MKHSLIIGLFFITLSMLGMAVSPKQTQSVACSSSCLLAFLQQPSDDSPKDNGRRRPGRIRPDKSAPSFADRKNPILSGQITPVMIEHCLEIVKEIDPDLAAQLATMCENDPEALRNIIRKQGHRLGSLIRLKESDPDLFKVKVTELKIDAEIYHVAQVYLALQPDDPKAQGVKAELEGLVRAKTEITIKAQALYIKRLERHLSGLQSKLKETSAQIDEIVQARLAKLLKVVHKDASKVPSQSD